MPLADMRRRAPKIWRSMVIACSVLLVATACTQFGHPRAIPEPIGRPLPYIEPAAWDAKGTIVSSEPWFSLAPTPRRLQVSVTHARPSTDRFPRITVRAPRFRAPSSCPRVTHQREAGR
jgi:hypothetical protein